MSKHLTDHLMKNAEAALRLSLGQLEWRNINVDPERIARVKEMFLEETATLLNRFPGRFSNRTIFDVYLKWYHIDTEAVFHSLGVICTVYDPHFAPATYVIEADFDDEDGPFQTSGVLANLR